MRAGALRSRRRTSRLAQSPRGRRRACTVRAATYSSVPGARPPVLTILQAQNSQRCLGVVRDAEGRDVTEARPEVDAIRIEENLASEILRRDVASPISLEITLDDDVSEDHEPDESSEIGEVDLTTGVLRLSKPYVFLERTEAARCD